MRVEQFRAGLTKLGAALDDLKAREIAADLALLVEFLRPYDESSVAGCLAGLRKQLQDKPPPPRRGVAVADPAALQSYVAQLTSARGKDPAIRHAVAALEGDKRLRLAELKAIAQNLDVAISAKTRPKAVQELLSALLYEVLQQNRLRGLDNPR